MLIHLRANKTQADYMIKLWREEDGMKVKYVVDNEVKYDKDGYGMHWLDITGKNSKMSIRAYHKIIQRLLNYSSQMIDHLQDARRMMTYIGKENP